MGGEVGDRSEVSWIADTVTTGADVGYHGLEDRERKHWGKVEVERMTIREK